MIDPEHDQLRWKYRVCRVAFALVGYGLGLVCFSTMVEAGIMLTAGRGGLGQFLLGLYQHPAWNWVIGAPIPWLTVVGSYLLIATWSDLSWRRRAGILFLLNLLDVIQWGVFHRDDLGLRLGQVGHAWLRHQVMGACQWAEYMLFASLAADMAAHFGSEVANDKNNKVRALAASGAALWGIGFLYSTDWHRWPLHGRAPIPKEVIFIDFGLVILTLITALNVTNLSFLAGRLCSRALIDLNREDREQGHDLLKSRSETGNDDFWKPPGA